MPNRPTYHAWGFYDDDGRPRPLDGVAVELGESPFGTYQRVVSNITHFGGPIENRSTTRTLRQLTHPATASPLVAAALGGLAVLTAHFIAWVDNNGSDDDEWWCACNEHFGYSDEATTHVAERVAAWLGKQLVTAREAVAESLYRADNALSDYATESEALEHERQLRLRGTRAVVWVVEGDA